MKGRRVRGHEGKGRRCSKKARIVDKEQGGGEGRTAQDRKGMREREKDW